MITGCQCAGPGAVRGHACFVARVFDLGLLLMRVEVIGSGARDVCGSVGMRRSAGGLGLAHTTVRDWRRRFACRAELLAVGFSRFCVAVGDLAPRIGGRPEAVAVAAAKAAWSAARRRFGGGVGGLWRLANAVVGGHLLSTNMDPPWAAS